MRGRLNSGERLGLLKWQHQISWSLLGLYLDGLTDAECLWEPGSPCWTVRPDADGHWSADWQVPEPAPMATTIGWLTWHVGFWWSQTYDDTFGAGRRLGHADVAWPGSADATVRWLQGLHDQWITALDSLEERDLDATERSGWFLRGTRPLSHVVAWVNTELMKNASEVGVMRRLYACSRES